MDSEMLARRELISSRSRDSSADTLSMFSRLELSMLSVSSLSKISVSNSWRREEMVSMVRKMNGNTSKKYIFFFQDSIREVGKLFLSSWSKCSELSLGSSQIQSQRRQRGIRSLELFLEGGSVFMLLSEFGLRSFVSFSEIALKLEDKAFVMNTGVTAYTEYCRLCLLLFHWQEFWTLEPVKRIKWFNTKFGTNFLTPLLESCKFLFLIFRRRLHGLNLLLQILQVRQLGSNSRWLVQKYAATGTPSFANTETEEPPFQKAFRTGPQRQFLRTKHQIEDLCWSGKQPRDALVGLSPHFQRYLLHLETVQAKREGEKTKEAKITCCSSSEMATAAASLFEANSELLIALKWKTENTSKPSFVQLLLSLREFLFEFLDGRINLVSQISFLFVLTLNPKRLNEVGLIQTWKWVIDRIWGRTHQQVSFSNHEFHAQRQRYLGPGHLDFPQRNPDEQLPSLKSIVGQLRSPC